MGDLSEHFSRWEFRCRCGECQHYAVDVELLKVLEDIHSHFGHHRVHINSGNRCPLHNHNSKGSSGSRHLFSIAVDFWVEGTPNDDVADYLEEEYPDKYGIGRYVSRTHLDIRSKKARWDVR